MIMKKRTKITEQMTQEIRDMYATREFTQNEIAGKRKKKEIGMM